MRSIVGKNVCQLNGYRFFEGVGVYLDFAKQHSVDYTVHEGIAAVFLLSKPTEHCGVVDAVLDLTRQIRKGENAEFKCYTAHEGGTTWGKWGHIIGLANNDNGLKRFVKARLAWRVDVKENRFEELKGQSVTCDTTGYDD